MSNTMLPEFDTKKFTDIWSSASDFITDYTGSGLYAMTNNRISTDSATALYYLLYSKHANDPIANYDENQFKYKVFSIIFEYGPAWEKRLDIQAKLRELNENNPEFRKGSKAIYNQALNPQTEPSTASLTELTYINQQNTTNYNKSLMDAYGQLWQLLDTDVTEAFLRRFQKLFKQFVKPERTWIYVTEEDEDDGN